MKKLIFLFLLISFFSGIVAFTTELAVAASNDITLVYYYFDG